MVGTFDSAAEWICVSAVAADVSVLLVGDDSCTTNTTICMIMLSFVSFNRYTMT